jgi:hypothetical protein
MTASRQCVPWAAAATLKWSPAGAPEEISETSCEAGEHQQPDHLKGGVLS